MLRTSIYLAAVTLVVLTASQVGLALDPQQTTGVSGLSGPAHVTAGWGRSTEDGLSRPGLPARIGWGSVGVSSAGSRGGLNPGTDSDFHLAGLGRVINGGVGRSTMETVPGRTPTYVNVVAGTRMSPYIGSRGP
jgi:hypothetical protein